MIDLKNLPHGGLWIPAKHNASDWLLVALHGSGGSCQDFSGLEDIFNISDLNYLYLNGPIKAYSGFRWYSDLGPRSDAYAVIQYALEHASKQGYPAKHTFLLGFSQGASLAIECGARYPRLLAGYIGISGRIENLPGLLSQSDAAIIHRGKWLITHGTKDYNLSIEIIRQQVEQMRQAGFHVDYREYEKIHEFDAKNELPDIRNWIISHMQ